MNLTSNIDEIKTLLYLTIKDRNLAPRDFKDVFTLLSKLKERIQITEGLIGTFEKELSK